jgi:hypothetical protein
MSQELWFEIMNDKYKNQILIECPLTNSYIHIQVQGQGMSSQILPFTHLVFQKPYSMTGFQTPKVLAFPQDAV